jgi:RNA polymerase sigma-70 factor (ECF subfamily)
VAKLLARANPVLAKLEMRTILLNGAPAGRIETEGEPTVVSLVMEDGRVTRIYVMRNPQKLTRLDQTSELVRRWRVSRGRKS